MFKKIDLQQDPFGIEEHFFFNFQDITVHNGKLFMRADHLQWSWILSDHKVRDSLVKQLNDIEDLCHSNLTSMQLQTHRDTIETRDGYSGPELVGMCLVNFQNKSLLLKKD